VATFPLTAASQTGDVLVEPARNSEVFAMGRFARRRGLHELYRMHGRCSPGDPPFWMERRSTFVAD